MNQRHLKHTAQLSLVMILFALLSLVTATYAWFTSKNQAVKTSKVDATTGGTDFYLYLSKTTDFSGKSTEMDLTSMIRTPLKDLQLLPVSTSDLINFVYSNSVATDDGSLQASSFHPVTGDEASGNDRLYHGQVYIEAEGTNLGDSSKAGIYLDGVDDAPAANPLSGTTDGFTNAVRVGLKFTPVDGGAAQTAILRMTESINSSGNAMDTAVNGKIISADSVLYSDSSGAVTAVTDPSKYYMDYVISGNSVPTALASLEINKAYLLDVYVYLEGCDPDCNETLAGLTAGDISLKFFSSLA